jgi:hypothetical protein
MIRILFGTAKSKTPIPAPFAAVGADRTGRDAFIRNGKKFNDRSMLLRSIGLVMRSPSRIELPTAP